jgi:hypothetical protein
VQLAAARAHLVERLLGDEHLLAQLRRRRSRDGVGTVDPGAVREAAGLAGRSGGAHGLARGAIRAHSVQSVQVEAHVGDLFPPVTRSLTGFFLYRGSSDVDRRT